MKGSKLRSWHQTCCIPGRWVPFKVSTTGGSGRQAFFFILCLHVTTHIPRQTSPKRPPPQAMSKKKVYAKQSIIHIEWSQIVGSQRAKYENSHDRLVATLVLPSPQRRHAIDKKQAHGVEGTMQCSSIAHGAAYGTTQDRAQLCRTLMPVELLHQLIFELNGQLAGKVVQCPGLGWGPALWFPLFLDWVFSGREAMTYDVISTLYGRRKAKTHNRSCDSTILTTGDGWMSSYG